MGSVTDKMNYLKETKSLIKGAIEDKGVVVSDSDPFRTYATKIAEIEGGGTIVNAAPKLLPYGDDGVNPRSASNPVIFENLEPGTYILGGNATFYCKALNSDTGTASRSYGFREFCLFETPTASMADGTVFGYMAGMSTSIFGMGFKKDSTQPAGLAIDTNSYYIDGNYVTVQNPNIISGLKTFTTLPVTSVVPTTANQFTNKAYVDDAVAAQTGSTTPLIDATALVGWFGSQTDGTNMTTEYGLTPETVGQCRVGVRLEWPSTLEPNTTISATIIKVKDGYDYKPEGGRYSIKTISTGYQPDVDLTYCYDDSNVYKNIWPENGGEPLACFVADTLVTTETGKTKIADIEVGDKVLSANAGFNITEFKEVLKKIEHETKEVIEITLGKEKIITTASHPFVTTNKGRAIAKWLEVGDELIDNKAKGHKITNIEKITRNETVYEILIADNHNYYISESQVLVINEPSVVYTNR